MVMANQVILPGEIKLRNFRIAIPGVTEITVIEFDDMAEKIRTAVMPDQTRRSSGAVDGGESSFKVPAHHITEIAALKAYYAQCRYALPGYKRDWIVTYYSSAGITSQGVILVGAFLTEKMLPGGKLEDEGNQVVNHWGFSWDEMLDL